MKKSFLFLIIVLIVKISIAQRIYIEGTRFKVDGALIYMNGCNTPWNNWNDFGGNYNSNFWESHFQSLQNYGINSSRIWISCDGTVQPDINADGTVTGVSQQFWNNVDDMLLRAKNHGIYIIATMMSFDHTKNSNKKYTNWRAMFADTSKVRSYINNYLLPFVNRYKDNPYLYNIDLCNEIEWVSSNSECGNLSWPVLQRFVAMCAAAIHRSGSQVLVSLGSACVKWNSDTWNGSVNIWSNANLQMRYKDTKAFLDFWQIHYYLWMDSNYSNPFTQSPSAYGINDRPVIIGEMPAVDSLLPKITIAQAFSKAYKLGYCGHYPWTSNGVDKYGKLSNFGSAALSFNNSIIGIDESIKDMDFIRIYPNPTTDKFFIEINKTGNVNLAIFDMTGRNIYTSTFTNKTEIDLSDFQKGFYFVRLSNSDITIIRRIIKQ